MDSLLVNKRWAYYLGLILRRLVGRGGEMKSCFIFNFIVLYWRTNKIKSHHKITGYAPVGWGG